MRADVIEAWMVLNATEIEILKNEKLTPISQELIDHIKTLKDRLLKTIIEDVKQ